MLKDFYNAILTRLGQIVTIPADPEADPIPVIKQKGWWNEQWAYEQQGNPLQFPCVFVEFVSFPWEQFSKQIQQSTCLIKLHIGSSNMDLENVDHLDLIEIINYAMTGFQGTNFGSWTRVGFESDHNHDKLTAHALTYKVRVQDNTAVRPKVQVDGDLLIIEVPAMDISLLNLLFTSSPAFAAAENQTVIGMVMATAGSSYSIVPGNDAAAFTINPLTGVLSFRTAPDFEQKTSYSLTVRATKGSVSKDQVIMVSVTDANEVPVITAQSFSINENSANGTTIGTVLASDPDAGQELTFSIISGNTNGAFAINPVTGQLSVSNAAALNFETTPVFSLVIMAQDNGAVNLSTLATITVNLLNVDESAVITLPTIADIADITATVGATLDCKGLSTIWSIEYGTTNAYGSIQAGGTTSTNGSVTIGLTGLVAETTYHWRLKAVNSQETSYSEDQSLITIWATLNQTPAYLKDGHTALVWDFETAPSMVFDVDNKVAEFKDVLLSGHDGLQAETKRKPRLTDEGLLFDSIDDFIKTLPFTLNRPTYVYAVLKQNVWKANARLWDGNADTSLGPIQLTASPNLTIAAASTLANPDNIIGEFVVIRTLNGVNVGGLSPSSYSQVNELTKHTGNTGLANAGGFTLADIGASHTVSAQANITVKHVTIRDAALSAEDESEFYAYLEAKKTKVLNKFDYTLVLGNSITIYPIPAAIWWGNWGMAASIKDNDFVHKLQAKLRIVNPKTVIYPANIAAWETAHTTYDKTLLDNYFLCNPKRVILRLAENVSKASVSDGTFATSLQSLIDYIKVKAPLAEIIITGMFWVSEARDLLLSALATNNSLTFIPLSHLDVADNKSSIGATVYDEAGGAHTVNDAGVAIHPNDAGMEGIAEAIYQGML